MQQQYRFRLGGLGFAERRSIFLVLLLFIGAAIVKGQDCNYSLTGTVIDEHDDSILEGATVYLLGQEKGAYVDQNGRFNLEGLCPGKDSLRVTHIGCEAIKVYVSINEESPSLTIFLEHHAELLDGIEVHGHRNQTASSDIGATLSGEQLDRSSGADFATVVERLPGVRQVGTGANVGRPLVDGLGGSRLQIVQGGMALASQDWGDEHALEIDPFATANVQLARSGNTVRYGASTTGASLVLDDALIPESEQITGKAMLRGASNAEALGGGLQLEQRLSKAIGFRVNASGAAQGDSRAPDYVLSNTGSKKASGLAQLFYVDSTLQLDMSYRGFAQETGILRAAHIGNLSDLERALNSDRPLIINPYTRSIDAPRQAVNHHWMTANARYQLQSDAALKLSYSFQVNNRREFDIRRGGRSAIPSLDLQLQTTDVRTVYEHPMFLGLNGQVGIQGTTAANRNQPGTGVEPFIPFYDASVVGLYVDERMVRDNTTWEFSGRTDVKSTTAAWLVRGESGTSRREEWNRTEWTGALSVGMAKYYDNGGSLRTRVAYASRTPNPAERFADGVHHALAVIEVGDTTLTVEHGVKGVLGYGLEGQDGFEFHVSAFAHVFNGFVYQENLPEPVLTVRGAFPVVAYRQAGALLAGLDLDVHAPIGPLRLDVEAGYLYGALKGGDPLPDIAPWQTSAELSYSRTTNGRFKDWRVAGLVHYVGEQRRIPDVLPAPPPAAYTLIGLEASSHIAVGEHVFGIHLSVANVFNKEYRDYLDRLRYYAARPGRNVQLRLLYDF